MNVAPSDWAMLHAVAPPSLTPGCVYLVWRHSVVGGSHDRTVSSSHCCWRPLLAQPSVECSVDQAGCTDLHWIAKRDDWRTGHRAAAALRSAHQPRAVLDFPNSGRPGRRDHTFSPGSCAQCVVRQDPRLRRRATTLRAGWCARKAAMTHMRENSRSRSATLQPASLDLRFSLAEFGLHEIREGSYLCRHHPSGRE